MTTVSDVLLLAKVAHYHALATSSKIQETPSWDEFVSAVKSLTEGVAEAKEDAARAQRSYERSDEKLQMILEGLQRDAITEPFNPHGCFVYTLWDRDGEVLYVGESTNVLGRLGSHLSDPYKRDRVSAVTTLRCKNERQMHETEGRLIRLHKPPLNIIGVSRD